MRIRSFLTLVVATAAFAAKPVSDLPVTAYLARLRYQQHAVLRPERCIRCLLEWRKQRQLDSGGQRIQPHHLGRLAPGLVHFNGPHRQDHLQHRQCRATGRPRVSGARQPALLGNTIRGGTHGEQVYAGQPRHADHESGRFVPMRDDHPAPGAQFWLLPPVHGQNLVLRDRRCAGVVQFCQFCWLQRLVHRSDPGG